MKATCPKDPSHDRFISTATITENWLMYSDGELIEVLDNGNHDVLHRPEPGDRWICATCGAQATVEATEED